MPVRRNHPQLGELVLEDPLGDCGLDDVGAVEAVDAVDAEDALLLADDAVRVHPAVPHRAHLSGLPFSGVVRIHGSNVNT